MTEASGQSLSSQPPRALVVAGDVMAPALTTVELDAHVAAAAYLMRHAGETALVVVADEQTKRPVGIITDADIVQAVADGKDLNSVRIRALMNSEPTVVSATTGIREVAETMVAGHFRHLPVVGDGGLIGMVDMSDVCRALLGPDAG